MKICWNNLNGIKLTRNGVFLKNGSSSYIHKDHCSRCNEPYLTSKSRPSLFCGKSCSFKGQKRWLGKKHSDITKQKMSKSAFKRSESEEYSKKLSEAQRGHKSHSWKGGVSKLNLPLYDTYAHQLWTEETRPVFKNSLKLLEVKCTKCEDWITPTISEVQNRMKFLSNKITSECRFYCSDKCKTGCSIYGQILFPKGFKKEVNKEYTRHELSIWSGEVLKRANYKCEYCGKNATDAHHIRPKKLEPFFALDPDYGVACCEKCHYDYAHLDECSTGTLAMRKCS